LASGVLIAWPALLIMFGMCFIISSVIMMLSFQDLFG
jgi:hypothetical protein